MRTIKFRAKIKSSRDADHKVGDWIYYSTKDVFENNFGHNLIRIENECQYTGLKDKNGKEIYFDDLFKYKNTIFRVIMWRGGITGKAKDDDYVSVYFIMRDLEVIGNTYE